MCVKSEQAIQLYNKACRSEQVGDANLAEVYYLKSWFLFQQVGGSHFLNAANALNAVTFLRWSRKDYEGALRSVKESMNLMETHGAKFSGADADLIRDTCWELLDQIRYEMSLASGIR